jgi:hypothetical protein
MVDKSWTGTAAMNVARAEDFEIASDRLVHFRAADDHAAGLAERVLSTERDCA